MPGAYKKYLKFNQEQKSIKVPFVIYADTKPTLEKIHTWDDVHIVPTKSFRSKKKRTYSLSIWTDSSESVNEPYPIKGIVNNYKNHPVSRKPRKTH